MIDIKVGDIIIFKGEGFAFQFLSRILKIFNPWWDRWGWHMAFVSKVNPTIICESEIQGVHENPMPQKEYRVYRWLEQPVDQAKVDQFVAEYLGKPYDVVIYFWTTAQYLFRHFWNRSIPRLLDDRYTCWELIFTFADHLGRQISADYDCPMLTDFLKHSPKEIKPVD